MAPGLRHIMVHEQPHHASLEAEGVGGGRWGGRGGGRGYGVDARVVRIEGRLQGGWRLHAFVRTHTQTGTPLSPLPININSTSTSTPAPPAPPCTPCTHWQGCGAAGLLLRAAHAAHRPPEA